MREKGISGPVILGVAALIIVVLLVTKGGEITKELADDKRAQTYIAAMGLRNAIMQLSFSERGMVDYVISQSDEYDIIITGNKLSVQYAGNTLPIYKPKVEMSHYTPSLTPTTLKGKAFCIVNQKNPAAGCAQVIAVYPKGDANCAVDTSVC